MIDGAGITEENADARHDGGASRGERSGTGHPRVDAALGRLAHVTAQPTTDQIEGYTLIHRELSETLAELDDGH
jgi:hypothetical protein